MIRYRQNPDMNASILESLVHQEQLATLDFKVQQYPFPSAAPEQKSELLKDILALANSWQNHAARWRKIFHKEALNCHALVQIVTDFFFQAGS